MFRIIGLLFISSMFLACTKDRFSPPSQNPTPEQESVIYFWNFNESNGSNISNPAISLGIGEMQYNGVWDYTDGTLLNSLNGTTPGNSLRLRNPAGAFVIKISTQGYAKLKLSYAVMRTNSGAQENIFSYSLDGINYYENGISPQSISVNLDFEIKTVDFSSINALNNQSEVYIKIDFNLGHTNESGNNRLDNITFRATSL